MNSQEQQFTGTWLHEGNGQGQEFSHSSDQYEHVGGDPAGSTRMRHAYVERNGGKVGVWVPENWTDEQVTQALETNW